MSTFRRGDLRHRINIEQKVNQVDSSGAVVQNPETGEIVTDWELVCAVWAKKMPLSSQEQMLAQQVNSAVNTRWLIEYRDDLASIAVANYRINHNGVLYDLKAPFEDPDSGREWLTIMATRGLNDG